MQNMMQESLIPRSHQVSEQPLNQPINQSINHPNNQLINRPISQPINQPVNQPLRPVPHFHQIPQPINQSVHQPLRQVDQANIQRIPHQSINPTNQSINEPGFKLTTNKVMIVLTLVWLIIPLILYNVPYGSDQPLYSKKHDCSSARKTCPSPRSDRCCSIDDGFYHLPHLLCSDDSCWETIMGELSMIVYFVLTAPVWVITWLIICCTRAYKTYNRQQNRGASVVLMEL